jgi:iron complex transport system ATP-binding protein
LVALLGPNGSGKSTLIKLLLGNLHAGSGTIEWEGKALRSWPRRELARTIAYLPQSPLWEPGQCVVDVIRTGRAPYWGAFGIESPRDAQIVEETARTLELTDLLNRDLDELSGGQRQRVFLARCLAQEPRAMLLDEPSTFLDLKHQVELLRMLRTFARERSLGILMASHDLNLSSAHADRIAVLSEGAVVVDAPPAQAMDAAALGRVYGVSLQAVQDERGHTVLLPSAFE